MRTPHLLTDLASGGGDLPQGGEEPGDLLSRGERPGAHAHRPFRERAERPVGVGRAVKARPHQDSELLFQPASHFLRFPIRPIPSTNSSSSTLSFRRTASIPLRSNHARETPRPAIPTLFGVPDSRASGKKSGWRSDSERLPVPPSISGTTGTPSRT